MPDINIFFSPFYFFTFFNLWGNTNKVSSYLQHLVITVILIHVYAIKGVGCMKIATIHKIYVINNHYTSYFDVHMDRHGFVFVSFKTYNIGISLARLELNDLWLLNIKLIIKKYIINIYQ